MTAYAALQATAAVLGLVLVLAATALGLILAEPQADSLTTRTENHP